MSVASLESLDTMSEGDALPAFTRGSRVRASLPVVRSTNQTKDRSLGVLYLQYGDESRQIRMPNQISSLDTVRAMFVGAFPQQLTMKMLESPSVAVYVKDDMRNMYYELADVRNIAAHSCLKVYHKDPAQAFSQTPRPSNGDPGRMPREGMYAGPPPLRQPPLGPPQHPSMSGSMSPSTPSSSVPSSPSRIPFGPPRQASLPAGGTMPRERLSNASPQVRSGSPGPSAILERRDVKPDEDLVGSRSHTLGRGSEPLYADPYLLQEGRMAMGHPGHEGPDHPGLAGGYHRASIRSTGSYGGGGPSPTMDTVDHPSLYRQRSRNSQLPTLGSKTPPPSPHRMTEMRMIDIHGGPLHGGPPHPGHHPLERCSSQRQSYRKEEVVAAKARGSVTSPVVSEAPQGPAQAGPHPTSNDPQTRERMKAMEQQIASLTGLVQHALLKGPSTGSAKDTTSERPSESSSPAQSINSTVSGGSPVLSLRNAPVQFDPVPGQRKVPVQAEKSWRPLQVNLKSFRKNISDLRLQLQQMRQQQLQNQEVLRQQLKWAEQEIGVKLVEAMRRADEPAHRQRTLVEEDRLKYLGLEQAVLSQLGDLEKYVDSLKRDYGGPSGRQVTLREVEEGAVSLRKVGEGLAGLKGEFPGLQGSMRAVLRVEVEAVKFLKEEPHKLDSMLKRVKSLTDTLSSLRRSATEVSTNGSVRPASGGHTSTTTTTTSTTTTTTLLAENPRGTPGHAASPGLTEADAPPLPAPRPQVKPPTSLMVVQHVQSAPVLIQHSQTSGDLTGVPADPPALQSPKARAPEAARRPSSSLLNNGASRKDMVIEELQSSQGRSRSRALSIEAAEKEWEERRQNMGQYDGREFEKLLQEAEANMMKGVPMPLTPPAVVEEPGRAANPADSPADAQPDGTAEKQPRPGPEKNDRPPKSAALERPSRSPTERTPAPKPAPAEKLPKPASEKGCKSPPPPPPRKTYISSGSAPGTVSGAGSGMTTTRSGEVVFTSKRNSGQEEEEKAQPPSPKPTPAKVSPVATPTPVLAEAPPKTATPPPHPEPITEGEDDGEKIMAELQVFQKCPVGGTLVEPQVKELRAGALPALKEKQTSDPAKEKEDKSPDTDENGNNPSRQSPAVIYYVTGQITKEPPPSTAPEESTERRESTFPPSQVSNVNANDHFPSQLPQSQPPPKPPPKPLARSPPVSPPVSPTSSSPPPISPKPVGLNGFKLPRKQIKRSVSLKTNRGTDVEKGNIILNQINNEKKLKSSVVQETNSKSIIVESVSTSTIHAPREPPTASLPERAPAEAADRPRDPPKGGDEEASLSPDLPGEEAPPPPDNIAFMITSSKVQALSCGEYQELVNSKKGNVQTVTVGEASNRCNATESEDTDASVAPDNSFNKKPVIIIFDEPMDIRSAYKRLSTIFETEEELERMLGEERIDEESEESDSDRSGARQVRGGGGSDVAVKAIGKAPADRGSLSSCSSSSSAELTDGVGNSESSVDGKQESKKKFKFKFPKKQLAALSQAIRTGTKSGKKTLQVVVYEDEEETDGTVRQHKEAKRFEIVRTEDNPTPLSVSNPVQRDTADSLHRTDEIRKNTYKTLDSLEQTIKQLETTISEMGPCSPEEPMAPEKPQMGEKKSSEGLKRSASLPSSRITGPKVSLPIKSSLRKKSKPQLLPRPVVVPTSTSTPAPSSPASVKQQNVVSPTSRMPVPLSTKARQSPGTTEKPAKQPKLPDAQRQFRQGNGSAKRADHKVPSPSVSKIPAFYPSATKGSSAPNPDATNTNNPSSSSSSSSSSNNKSSLPSPHHPPRSSSSSSHLPSLSNGNPKPTPPPPSQHAGKTLSFSSPQTQNTRVHSYSSSSSSYSSSSSSSPSPLSPTPLGPGGRSIRTIHTPSFTSYRSHNGSSAKSCIPTATKDSA